MKILNGLLSLSLLFGLSQAEPMKGDTPYTPSSNKILAYTWTYNKSFDKEFFKFTEKLDKIGFYLNDPHHNVNVVYEQREGPSYLETLNFNSLIKEDTIRPLINIDPRIAAFTPFNLLMYRTKADKQTVIARLDAQAMLDILEINDPRITKPFIAMFPPLDQAVDEKFPGAKKGTVALKGYAKDTMMNVEIPFDEPEDIDDFLDEFQEKFEAKFQEKGYIIAGYYNLKDSYNDDTDVLEQFVSFWSYDLCHIPYSYKIFDGKHAEPIAGIFAPCSMYVYVKEGENKFVIGMPTLEAWGASLGITNKKQLEEMHNLDVDIVKILKGFGGVEVPNGNPLKR